MFCWLVNVGYIILVCSMFVYQVPSHPLRHSLRGPPGRLLETATEEVLEVQRSTAPKNHLDPWDLLGPLGTSTGACRGRTTKTSAVDGLPSPRILVLLMAIDDFLWLFIDGYLYFSGLFPHLQITQ